MSAATLYYKILTKLHINGYSGVKNIHSIKHLQQNSNFLSERVGGFSDASSMLQTQSSVTLSVNFLYRQSGQTVKSYT